MYELVYTSAPRGLRPGASGYTVVAQTAGIPAALASSLEGLSLYRHRHVAADAGDGVNPVIFGHYLLSVGFQKYHVLTRIVDAGLDYSGRGNFLAHHLAVADEELPPGGPAWVLNHSGVFRDRWDEAPASLPPRGQMRAGDAPPKRCRGWEQTLGDAGWGGVLAAALDPARPAVIVFQPGQDVLPLISESLALLSPDERWQVTFSTYYLGTPAGVRCQWRCVPADSPDLSKFMASGVVIRADRPTREEPEGPLVEAARNGTAPAVAAPSRRSESITPPSAAVYTPPARVEPPAPLRAPSRVPAPSPKAAAAETRTARELDHHEPAGGLGRMLIGLGIGAAAATILLVGIEAATGNGLLGLMANKDKADAAGLAERDAAIDQKNQAEERANRFEQEAKGLRERLREFNDRPRPFHSPDPEPKKDVKSEPKKDVKLEPKKDVKSEPPKSDPPKVEAPKPPMDKAGTNGPSKGKDKKTETEKHSPPAIGSFQPRGINKNEASELVLDDVEKVELGDLPSYMDKPIETKSGYTLSLTIPAGKDQQGTPTPPQRVEVGQLVATKNSSKTTLEIKPPDNQATNGVTPLIQAGLIQIATSKKPRQYYLAYKPAVFSGHQVLEEKRQPDANIRAWWWSRLKSGIFSQKLFDYNLYTERGGELKFRPKAQIVVGTETITLTSSDGKLADKLTHKAKDNKVYSMYLDKGDLIVTTPPDIRECKIEFADVVRPVGNKEFEDVGLEVFSLGKMK
ncbi:GAP1-N2 domain-containing protein [Limnoglobus roseus]|uniref:Uncharacterized protein n=1 Tax=Limnoglobus roseus TaxID=2598579 RepID=A0A5C1AAD6_9BACT|nr:hypothetical protein [Limnoglobus roseus]QEL14074.1 hypothetical protein PX52LOC_00937 [Limnoglobus roseus]